MILTEAALAICLTYAIPADTPTLTYGQRIAKLESCAMRTDDPDQIGEVADAWAACLTSCTRRKLK